MSWQEQIYSWLFSSSPNLGAQSISPDGSTFSTFLQEPFTLPKNAFGIEVAAVQASIWFTQPNITAENNRFDFEGTGIGGGPQSLFLPIGLYSFDSLNATLQQILFTSYGVSNYSLIAVQSTQRVSEQFTATAAPAPRLYVTRWPVGTFYELLGFDLNRATAGGPSNGTFPGDKTARFNAIDFFLIQSSIVNRGIRTNNTFQSVVCQVPITSPPGSLIVFQPVNLQWTAAPELLGSTVSTIQTSLLDSNGRAVNTQGEPYSVTMQVRWKVPLY